MLHGKIMAFRKTQTFTSADASRALNELTGLKAFIHDKNEHIYAVLGHGFLMNYLRGDISNTLVILTNKRIYLRGRQILNQGFRTVQIDGEHVCNLKEATGSLYTVNSQPFWMVIQVVLFAGALIFMGSSNPIDWKNGAAFVPSFAALAAYFLTKKRVFQINYNGGSIATNANNYSIEEIQLFQKNISMLQERQQA